MIIQKPSLNEGEIYVGLIGQANGEAYHLILLPGDNNDATHQHQMDWAKSIGGDPPDRIEQAMLFKHFKSEFKEDWYWSNETHQRGSSGAWCQSFGYGSQDTYHKRFELRARAVRRVPIYGHPMSNTKTEAQRLADHLERVWYQHEAAAELRRLDAVEQRHNEMMANPCPEWDNKAYMQAIDSLRAQVKQAELERDEAQTKCQELSAQLVEAGKNEDAWRAQLVKAVASKCELLEALERYLIQDEIAEGYGGGVGGSVREQARAAIAKATGEHHD